MALVSVKPVSSYDNEAELYSAVEAHFAATGADKALVPGMRVLIKPNLLTGRKPDSAVTTHPALLCAAVKYVLSRGVTDIVIADSPSGPYLAAALKMAYSASGYSTDALAPYLNYDVSFRSVKTPEGFNVRAFDIISPIADADYIINLPKLKTHAMTTMSCAVKNLFGAVPGLQKPDLHFRFPEADKFGEMLCELAETVKPAITIVDAVTSMEGNGPGGGTARFTGMTFASADLYALDAVCARFMGIEPDTVPYLAAARRRGFLTDSIELCGDFAPAEPPFALPDAVVGIDLCGGVPRFLQPAVAFAAKKILRSFPKIVRANCIGCGKCAESCPRHIITVSNGKAVIPRRGCISCFCCQEMCPAHAIKVKQGLKL